MRKRIESILMNIAIGVLVGSILGGMIWIVVTFAIIVKELLIKQ